MRLPPHAKLLLPTAVVMALQGASLPAGAEPSESAPGLPTDSAPSAQASREHGDGLTGEEPAAPAPLPSDEKRPLPDYDGRGEPTAPGEAALWVPRSILFPAFFATEYLVRRPLGALTKLVEQENVLSKLEDLFTFGPENNIGVVPTALVDFGFHASVGVYFFWDDFAARDNDLRVNLATGGARWLKAQVADRIHLDPRTTLQLEAYAVQRPDLRYWGVGPRTLDEAEGAFEVRTVGGGARLRRRIDEHASFFESWVTSRAFAFDDGECEDPSVRAGDPPRFYCEDFTVSGSVRAGNYPVPAGFGGYSVLEAGSRLVLDSRRPRPAPGTGVALDLDLRQVGQLVGEGSSAWVGYGGTLAGFADLTGTQRVLSLSIRAQLLSSFHDGDAIPFIELIGARRIDDSPDGDLLDGFRPGRLLGRSSLFAALEYRWPVWTWVDALLQTGVGNTFGAHFEDFDPERLRFAFAGGLRSTNHRDHSFNLLLGFGTETFEQGAAPNSVRFLLGGTVGF